MILVFGMMPMIIPNANPAASWPGELVPTSDLAARRIDGTTVDSIRNPFRSRERGFVPTDVWTGDARTGLKRLSTTSRRPLIGCRAFVRYRRYQCNLLRAVSLSHAILAAPQP